MDHSGVAVEEPVDLAGAGDHADARFTIDALHAAPVRAVMLAARRSTVWSVTAPAVMSEMSISRRINLLLATLIAEVPVSEMIINRHCEPGGIDG